MDRFIAVAVALSSFRFAARPSCCDAAAGPKLLLDVVVDEAALGAATVADMVDIVTTLPVVDGVCGGVVLRFTGCPPLSPVLSLRSLLTRVTDTADAADEAEADAEAAALGETAAEDLEEDMAEAEAKAAIIFIVENVKRKNKIQIKKILSNVN